MNRAKLRTMLLLVSSITIGTVTYNIYAPKNDVTEADLADAGVASANRVATCPVRVSDGCRARFGLKRYETVRFPIFVDPQDATMTNVLLPPAARVVKSCIEVVDFTQCDVDPTASFPAVALNWGDPNPFTRVPSATKYVIPDCRNPDGGWSDAHEPVDCLRSLPLKKFGWVGCNVIPRGESSGSQCLPAPSGSVILGDRLEESM